MLPDSGSVVDIVSTKLAQSLGLDLIEVQDSDYQIAAANGQNISMSHEANFRPKFSSENQSFNIICLISPNLQWDEIIKSWISMMKLGLFVAPNSSMHISNSQILSLDSVSVILPEENKIFLKSPLH